VVSPRHSVTDTVPRRVVLLGATGSIGRQCCDVIERFPERFRLVGAVAGSDADGLAAIVDRLRVDRAALMTPSPGRRLPAGMHAGGDAVAAIAAMECDVVCVAIPGAAALAPTLAALDAGRTIATATKEVLVMAGELVKERAAAAGARILPVDSEHSALWQCLRGEQADSIRRLVLTASGGPFRERDTATFGHITVEEALRHPTWNMGPKVTIDSATMMNKGLEVIEAHFLFDVPYSSIDVVIHPRSIVHSFVEFVDGAVMAQLGVPDMRVPIALAIADGVRLPGIAPAVQLTSVSPLEFFEADARRFPAVALARSAGETGGVAPAALNAANEVAVAAFLAGRIGYDGIVPVVAATVSAAPSVVTPSLTDILETDRWARAFATARLDTVASPA
jgi:1-deoxy-D-xylulose-5-phosphate reductoisomerase